MLRPAEKTGERRTLPAWHQGLATYCFRTEWQRTICTVLFLDSYKVSTWKDGTAIEVRVDLAAEGLTPFSISPVKESRKAGHGTKVSAAVDKHLLPGDDICKLIGSKFLVDPSLVISVNGNDVQLLALEGLKTKVVEAVPHGSVTIHFIDSIEHYRTSQLRGITWWVNQRHGRGTKLGSP